MRDLIPPPMTVIMFALIGLLCMLGPKQAQFPEPKDLILDAEPHSAIKSNFENNKATISQPRKEIVAIISERPLFSPTRRKPEPLPPELEPEPEIVEVEEVPEPLPEPEPIPQKPHLDAEFLGLLQEEGIYKALLSVAGQQNWVNVGEIVDGWEITNINDEKVTLQYKEQVFTIPIAR